jgi:hypothetical protein
MQYPQLRLAQRLGTRLRTSARDRTLRICVYVSSTLSSMDGCSNITATSRSTPAVSFMTTNLGLAGVSAGNQQTTNTLLVDAAPARNQTYTCKLSGPQQTAAPVRS